MECEVVLIACGVSWSLGYITGRSHQKPTLELEEPLPIPANDSRVLVNGHPLSVPFRIVAENLYQEMKNDRYHLTFK